MESVESNSPRSFQKKCASSDCIVKCSWSSDLCFPHHGPSLVTLQAGKPHSSWKYRAAVFAEHWMQQMVMIVEQKWKILWWGSLPNIGFNPMRRSQMNLPSQRQRASHKCLRSSDEELEICANNFPVAVFKRISLLTRSRLRYWVNIIDDASDHSSNVYIGCYKKQSWSPTCGFAWQWFLSP